MNSQYRSTSTINNTMKQCHVCGNEFNKASLSVHQQRCIQNILTKIKTSSQTTTRDSSAISNRGAVTSLSTVNTSKNSAASSSRVNSKPAYHQQQSKDTFDEFMIYNTAAPAAGPTFNNYGTHNSKSSSARANPNHQVNSNSASTQRKQQDSAQEKEMTSYSGSSYEQLQQASDEQQDDFEYPQQDEYPDEYPSQEARHPCPICNRKFSDEERLEKHKKACVKAQKPRKAFDASKARVKGTELEQFAVHIKIGSGKSKTKAPEKQEKPKSNWRLKHENLLRMLRAARQGGETLSQERVIDISDHIQCPHCSRNFNQEVAERHIPICQEITAKAKMRAAGSSYKSTEKESVYKKRMGYRPPPPKSNSKSATSSPQKTNPSSPVKSIPSHSPSKSSYAR